MARVEYVETRSGVTAQVHGVDTPAPNVFVHAEHIDAPFAVRTFDTKLLLDIGPDCHVFLTTEQAIDIARLLLDWSTE